MHDWERVLGLILAGDCLFIHSSREALLTALRGSANARLFCNFVARCLEAGKRRITLHRYMHSNDDGEKVNNVIRAYVKQIYVRRTSTNQEMTPALLCRSDLASSLTRAQSILRGALYARFASTPFNTLAITNRPITF